MGSVVKAKDGNIEDNTRERIITRTRKDMFGCVQAVAGKRRFIVKFKKGQNKKMSYCSLVFLCSNEEVDMDEPLSNCSKKERGELLIIDGNPEVG